MIKFKRLPDLNKRLVASLSIAAIFAFLIAFSWHPWVGMLMVFGAALLAVVGIWEYVQLARTKDLKPATKLMMGLAFCEVIIFSLAQKSPSFALLPLAILLIGLVGFFIFHFRESSDALLNIAVEFFWRATSLSHLFHARRPLSTNPSRSDKMAALVVESCYKNDRWCYCRRSKKMLTDFALKPSKAPSPVSSGSGNQYADSILSTFQGCRLAFADSIWLNLICVMGRRGDLANPSAAMRR
jgi:hypothetical protein